MCGHSKAEKKKMQGKNSSEVKVTGDEDKQVLFHAASPGYLSSWASLLIQGNATDTERPGRGVIDQNPPEEAGIAGVALRKRNQTRPCGVTSFKDWAPQGNTELD